MTSKLQSPSVQTSQSEAAYNQTHSTLASLGHSYQPEFVEHLAGMGFLLIVDQLEKENPVLADLLQDAWMLNEFAADAKAGNLQDTGADMLASLLPEFTRKYWELGGELRDEGGITSKK